MWMAVFFFTVYYVLSQTIGITLTSIIGFIHLIFVPLIFKYNKTFQQQLVFLNYIQWPIHSDFSRPSIVGVEGARNFYIEHRSVMNFRKIQIGTWHVLPISSWKKLKNDLSTEANPGEIERIFLEELKNSDRPVIMYCHGNANHRAAHHRVKLYQVLQEIDFHVIAFDYRGYGDSTFILPTENGVVEDTVNVYDWLLKHVDRSRVYMWGHSLGTGVASHVLGNLDYLSKNILDVKLKGPAGLILESPFNNLREEVDAHFMTFMVRWLPYFETSILKPFSGQRYYEFRSDAHLTRTDVPILILHAKDDYVVPCRLAAKLCMTIRNNRGRSDDVLFHVYEGSLNLGHTWICLAKDLPNVLSNFLDLCSLHSTPNGAIPKRDYVG